MAIVAVEHPQGIKGFLANILFTQKVIAPRVLMKLDFPEKGYGPGSEVKTISLAAATAMGLSAQRAPPFR